MLAWLPSRPTAVSVHWPLTVSRPRTVRPRSVKKAIAASRSWTAMPTFSSLMGMHDTLPTRLARFGSRVGSRSRFVLIVAGELLLRDGKGVVGGRDAEVDGRLEEDLLDLLDGEAVASGCAHVHGE